MSDESVMVIAPDRRLQRKVGGSASRHLSPSALKRAELAIEEAVPAAKAAVRDRLREIEQMARTRAFGARSGIWSHAHEIRGIAGTVGLQHLGAVAQQMCAYLEGTQDDFMPDPNLITTLAVLASETAKGGTDALLDALLEECGQAVRAQRKREGRPETAD